MYILLRRRRKESDIRVLAQRASYQKLPDWFIFAVCTIAHSSKKEKRVICEWEGGQHRGSPESHESVEGCLLHLQMNLPASWLYSIWNILGVFLFSCTIVKMLNSTILKKKLKVLSNRLLTQPFSCYCALTLLYTFKWLFKHQGILQFVRFQCKQELEQPSGDFMAELQKVALKFPLIKCFPAGPIFPCSKLFKIWQNISVHIFHGRATQREKSMERNCNMRKKKNRSSDISSLFPTEENC